MIKVSVGIIEKEGKYLCAQRREDKVLALKWEFPGGKFENNETEEEALIRELKEELNVEITNITKYDNYSYDYGFGDYDIHFFLCDIVDDSNITLSEHLQYGWFTLKELAEMDFVESSRKILNRLGEN